MEEKNMEFRKIEIKEETAEVIISLSIMLIISGIIAIAYYLGGLGT